MLCQVLYNIFKIYSNFNVFNFISCGKVELIPILIFNRIIEKFLLYLLNIKCLILKSFINLIKSLRYPLFIDKNCIIYENFTHLLNL